ncbi:MAG: NTP/NDP exchange transporter [Bryobacteraceae bacterium]
MCASVVRFPRAGRWERLVSAVTVVRRGEGPLALLLSLQVAVLMAAYYVLKAARDALVLTEGGAEVRSYAAAGQALLLFAVAPAYGWIASRLNPVRFIRLLSAFAVSNLVAFAVAGNAGWTIGVPFYLWVGVFNVTAIAQFWAFASDVYSEDQGQRLFAVLGIGSALGGFAGAQAASFLFTRLGPYSLMGVAAVLLALSMGIVSVAQRLARCGRESGAKRIAEPIKGASNGFRMVFASRYLTLIAAMVVLLNLVNTTGEFMLSKMAVEEAHKVAATPVARQQFIGSFYAGYYAWITLAGALAQVLLASRVLRWVGAGGALLILPAIALGGYAAFAVAPALAIIKMTKVLENSTDYSIAATARHALLLPASRETRYKAKSVIDTFFYRIGDLAQGGIVAIGHYFAFSLSGYALVNVGFTIVWLAVATALYAQHRELMRPTPIVAPQHGSHPAPAGGLAPRTERLVG